MYKFQKVFGKDKILIGMVHLGPLLGYSGYPSIDVLIENAVYDAKVLLEAGYDALLIENNYDLPHVEFVDTGVACCMGTCIKEVQNLARNIPMGVCVLWNDYKTALALAKIYKLSFVRIPVLVDYIRTSFGDINPCHEGLREYRDRFSVEDILVMSDIQVKHSEILNKRDISESALEAIQEGSDALIVTGKWTGDAPNLSKIKTVREKVGDFPIVIGSGTDSENVDELLKIADGCIVGTSIKVGSAFDSKVERNIKPYEYRVDPLKAKELTKKALKK